MNAARPTGLDIGPTRPLSRAERRAEAARVAAEQSSATTTYDQSDDAPAPAAPTAAAAVKIPMKKAARKKRPIATQVRPETLTRIEWVQERGAALTDLVDAALTAYLDAAGVPHPKPDGTMPTG